MIIPSVAEIKAELSRRSILKLVQADKPDYQPGWFNRDLCEKLKKFYEDVKAGLCPRLMIFAPPQHGKSTLASQYFPAWALGQDKNLRIVDASYALTLAEKNCAAAQQIMLGEAYRRAFPDSRIGKNVIVEGELKKKQTNDFYEIVGGQGFYKAVGIGGSLTGFPFDIGLIDDPFKDHQEAYSETTREAVWNWYSTVFFTRKSPKHGIIIINTRWHDDDLCGRLINLEPDKWTVLNYRAIATEDEAHRKKGEALHPERYPVHMLEEFRSKYPVFFAAMYQGDPIPASGNIFKKSMFEFAPMPAEFDYLFIMGDTAYKDKHENDYQCLTCFGVKGLQLHIVDVFREKMTAADVETPFENFIRQYMDYGFRGAYIEPKGHGIYLNQELPRRGIIMPSEEELKEFYADRNINKVERANNAVPYLGFRKILINEKLHDRENLLKELLSFPKAKNDDFTDTVIDGIKKVFARSLSMFDVM